LNKTGPKFGSKPVPTGARRTTAPTGASAGSRPTARPLRERPAAGQAGNTTKTSSSDNAAAAVADAELMKKNAELTTKLAEMELGVVEIERERDFYFQKLRDIEVMLQVHQEKGEESEPDALIEKVFKVLYATAEDGLVVNDDGEVRVRC